MATRLLADLSALSRRRAKPDLEGEIRARWDELGVADLALLAAISASSAAAETPSHREAMHLRRRHHPRYDERQTLSPALAYDFAVRTQLPFGPGILSSPRFHLLCASEVVADALMSTWGVADPVLASWLRADWEAFCALTIEEPRELLDVAAALLCDDPEPRITLALELARAALAVLPDEDLDPPR